MAVVKAGVRFLGLAMLASVLVACGDAILRLDLASGLVDPLARAPAQPANATLNDGRVDRQGRFVIGSCCTDFAAPSPVGGIYGRCQSVANSSPRDAATAQSPNLRP